MNLTFIDFIKQNTLILKISLILILILFVVLIFFINKIKLKKDIKIRNIVLISIFSALSYVLYFIKISLPIFPSFLEMNLSMLPIIILGFILGPSEGISAVLIRTVLKLPFTSTACVGEIADMLIGLIVSLSTSLIYKNHKTKKGAIIALIIGCILWTISSVVINYLINIPLYLAMYFNNDKSILIGMLSMIPNVNETNYMIKYLLYAVVPFNLILSSIVSLITFLIYKKISFLCKNNIDKESN